VTDKPDTSLKNGSPNGETHSHNDDEAAGVRSKYRALDYWIRNHCMPGKIDPANAECARGAELAALNDLKRLLGIGTIGEFAELAATYCQVRGGFDEEEKGRKSE